MALKKRIVRSFLNWTDSWNNEFHNAIEARVKDEYSRMFQPGLPTAPETLERMRSFYYSRLMGTATIMLACVGVIVALIALIIAVVPLIHTWQAPSPADCPIQVSIGK